MNFTLEELKKLMAERDFAIFERDDKPFNLNLVAIRTPDKAPNVFNDVLCIFWKFRGVWSFLQFKCTTDAGTYWLGPERMGNYKGTAMLIEQQVRGMYKWGRHKRYAALEQVKPAKFVRDNNRDGILNPDFSVIYEDDISTNLHRASQMSVTYSVGPYSAGCPVVASPWDFDMLAYCCKQSRKFWSNSFTFTLIDLQNG